MFADDTDVLIRDWDLQLTVTRPQTVINSFIQRFNKWNMKMDEDHYIKAS